MIADDQDSIFEAITNRVAGTAVWRRSMMLKFPDDSRNLPAAVLLEEMAQADSTEVLPATWAHLEFENPRFSQVLNDAARDVGFRCKVKNVDQLVRLVADRLANLPWGAK
jgi:hypothetical protein